MSRESRRQIVDENLQILDIGFYYYHGEQKMLKLSKAERMLTEVYAPDQVLSLQSTSPKRFAQTEISVNNLNSFDAALDAKKSGSRAIVLNFANAYIPGGGFLKGANAQEEVLCRQSSLYQSISSAKAAVMYAENNSRDGLKTDSDYMLISPYVEVFRKANGEYLEDSFFVSVLSLPAPNLKMKASALTHAELVSERRNKLRKGFRVCSFAGYDTLILGAWGCGAYGNDAADVAADMHAVLLQEGMASEFKQIIFAVYDTKPENPNLNAFISVFPNHSRIFSESPVSEDISRTKNPKKQKFTEEEAVFSDRNNILSVSVQSSEEIKQMHEHISTGKYAPDRMQTSAKISVTGTDFPMFRINALEAMQSDLGYTQGFTSDGRAFVAELFAYERTDAVCLNIVMSAAGFHFAAETEEAGERFRSDINSAPWKLSVLTKDLPVLYGGYGARFSGYAAEISDYVRTMGFVRFLDMKQDDLVVYMSRDINGHPVLVFSILLKSGDMLKAKVNWDFVPFGAISGKLTAKFIVEMPEDGSAPSGQNAGIFYKSSSR